ncbi:MAG: hypothetical protein JO316_08220 [Abitibacteriaceae bacterium]|nr:hypothetical protein [Abditibacteriaceae bacterium]
MKNLRHLSIRLAAGITLLAALAQSSLQPAQAAPEALAFSGSLPDVKNIEIENSHVYDYTFTTAPTDWWVQSGIWEMTNRWSCSPGWSWFGGRSAGTTEEPAVAWNKHHFQGDFSLQFYFAFKHKLPVVPEIWRYRLADAGVSFCADGKNIGTGYNLIIGADNNTHTFLWRQDKVVADSQAKEALLPTVADGFPDDLNILHRRWWYVKINKIGPRLECWLDNKLLFTYRDPKPLTTGQFALWTFNNGIMLSRVQIYYENEVRPVLVKSTPAKPVIKVASRLAR